MLKYAIKLLVTISVCILCACVAEPDQPKSSSSSSSASTSGIVSSSSSSASTSSSTSSSSSASSSTSSSSSSSASSSSSNSSSGAHVSPPVVDLPARIQSEDFSRFQDSDEKQRGSCGDGPVDMVKVPDGKLGQCDVAFTEPGEWLEYDINVPEAGYYDLTLNLAADQAASIVEVQIDNKKVAKLQSQSLGLQDYRNATSQLLNLKSGSHTVRVEFISGGVNFNFIEFKKVNESIKLFNKEHVYFKAGDNRRNVEKSFNFSGFDNEQLELSLTLSCPNRRCDWWDRKASLYIIDARNRQFELLRFMTPYRVGASWTVDISHLTPLFSEDVKFKVFIDTWVGPGHEQGDGWLVDANLAIKGQQSQQPLSVVPAFFRQNIEYGNPEVETRLAREITIPANAKSAMMISTITGHGQGNTQNCAEFCQKDHTLKFGNRSFKKRIWRANCRQTKTDGVQLGTWQFARAGWCPGDKVDYWKEQFNLQQSGKVEVSWQPQSYVNRLNSNYNNGSHTKPYYFVSSYLVFYR